MTDPPGAEVSTARTRDGLRLRTLRWAASPRRAHLLIVHGIAEHAGRHARVGEAFARAGLDTQAYDLRGFGASEGPRAYVDRWSQHHDDLEDQLAATRAVAGDLPVVLYGHSLGGLIALGYVFAEPPRPQPDLLVLSAPAIAATVASWKRVLAGVLGRLAPHFAIANELPVGGLAHDPQVELDYRADPLNVHRTTTRFGLEAFTEQARVQRLLARTRGLPMLTYVFHGADDPIVPLAATAPLAGKHNVTRRVYPGLRHEMHNETEADGVIADTIAWIGEALTRARDSVTVWLHIPEVRVVVEALAVRLETYIDARPERVWNALATADAWRQWFNAKTQLEPRVGGRFRVEGTHGDTQYVFVGEVVVFDPPREIAVTWIPVGTDWPFPDLHSIVRFTLAPEGSGTRVRVSHEGFERLPEPFRTKEFRDFSRGWSADEELTWLRDYVERRVSHFA